MTDLNGLGALAKRRNSGKGLVPVNVPSKAKGDEIRYSFSNPAMLVLTRTASSTSSPDLSPKYARSPSTTARVMPDSPALSTSQSIKPSLAKYGILKRPISNPDLRGAAAGFRLTPLATPPHSAKETKKEETWKPYSYDDRSEKERTEEAAWGTSVLSSLSPKYPKNFSWGFPKTMLPSSVRVTSKRAAGGGNSYDSAKKLESRRIDELTDCSDCGPTQEDALARLESGGLSQSELKQMTILFNRYKPTDCSEVQKDSLHSILAHLNNFFISKDRVERISGEVTEYAALDFQEFESFTTRWCEFERQEIQEIYASATEDKKGVVLPDDMACLLKPLGLVFVRTVVAEALQKAKLEHRGCRSFKDFLGFLAAYQAAQGFSRAQLIAAKQAFNEQASGEPATLKASKHLLSIALVQARGEHVAQFLPDILEGIHWDYHNDISFREFCSFLRKLWQVELKQFEDLYTKECKDADGSVSLDGLLDIMKSAGFTLFSKVTDEILEDMQVPRTKRFDFSDAVQFLLGCQRRKGFSNSEFVELSDVFQRFDYDGSNDIDHLELVDMIRYLGYATNLKESRRLLDKFDFKETGTLDFSGFLHFMRLHTEQQLKVISTTYEECKGESDNMPPTLLDEALERLGYEPMPDVVEGLLSEIGKPAFLSYENFVYVVDHFRRLSTIEKRKRAGFSDKEFQIVSELFMKHSTSHDEDGALVKGALILLLIDAGIPMETSDKRKEIYEMVAGAREAAKDVGIEEKRLGRPSSPRCRFWPLVHLLRAIFQKSDRRAVQREEEAVEETQFQPPEVNQFRDIFLRCCRGGKVPAVEDTSERNLERQDSSSDANARGQRRASLGAAPDSGERSSKRASTGATTDLQEIRNVQQQESPSKSTRGLSLRDVMGGDPEAVFAKVKYILAVVSEKLGVTFSAAQKYDFEQQVSTITGKRDNLVDFSDFLRLMKWMLDNDFANIKSVANKIERVRSSVR